MANVTIQNLLDGIVAQKTAASSLDAYPVVTRERFVTADGVTSLLTSLNDDKKVRGIVILWSQIISQEKGPVNCWITQRHRFTVEVFTPYEDHRTDNTTSHQLHVGIVEALNNAINLVENEIPWALGITETGSRVEHQFLQSDGPLAVIDLDIAEGSKVHRSGFTLDVLCSVNSHT